MIIAIAMLHVIADIDMMMRGTLQSTVLVLYLLKSEVVCLLLLFCDFYMKGNT